MCHFLTLFQCYINVTNTHIVFLESNTQIEILNGTLIEECVDLSYALKILNSRENIYMESYM